MQQRYWGYCEVSTVVEGVVHQCYKGHYEVWSVVESNKNQETWV